CRDTGNADVGNAVSGQYLDLFTATTEDERVATLQPGNTQATSCVLDQELIDTVLNLVIAGIFADKDALGVTAGALEHRLWHQAVVQNNIRLLQQLHGAQGQQVRISRAGTNEVDLAQAGGPGRR